MPNFYRTVAWINVQVTRDSYRASGFEIDDSEVQGIVVISALLYPFNITHECRERTIR